MLLREPRKVKEGLRVLACGSGLSAKVYGAACAKESMQKGAI